MLQQILLVLGWIFVAVPTIAFLSISFYMIQGASKDDLSVKALSLIGLTLFFMGTIILLFLYLTNFFG